MNKPRNLTRVIDARPAADGDGVKIRRIAGQHLHAVLDPFLMLDEIHSDDSADYIGGFPSHPHRGFETITYMLDGRMRHRDHMGNEGLLEPGGVQWMTAGRGVIHSEMPEQQAGLLHGFQLWLNLPAAEKMRAAAYQDFQDGEMPRLKLEGGVDVKLIAGSVAGQEGVISHPLTEPTILDVQLPATAAFSWNWPVEQTVLVFVYAGSITAQDSEWNLQAGQMGVFTQGERLQIAAPDDIAKVLVLAGRPLREQVHQYGPFVMNSVEQIEQALSDYNRGTLV